ncbi:Calx-beta domain-containing protein [Paenibacillus sambharensis]|nr:Calx-beta domain-containing protein [Paenibacillus sambharensis]
MIRRRQARPMTALVLACLLALAMPAASFAAANDVTANSTDRFYFTATHDGWIGEYLNYGGDYILVEIGRSSASDKSVTVDYTTIDGTAKAGVDYEHTSGTLTFGPREYMKELRIPVYNVQPGVYEPGYKTATIQLSNPTGGSSIPANPSANLRVYDPEASLSFSRAAESVTEGEFIEVSAAYKRVTQFEARIEVVGGTAEEGTDFLIRNDKLTMGALNDDYEDSEYRYPSLYIIDDEEVEGEETIELAWVSDDPSVIIQDPKILTITIQDNDTNSPAVFQFNNIDYQGIENSGHVTVTVIRSTGNQGAASVSYTTVGGSAAAGSDFTSTSGTLQFGPYEYQKTILIPITDDSVPEYAEQFNMQLSVPTGGNAVLGSPSTATVTILDDDPQPEIPAGQKIQFLRDAYFISESIGAITVTVERSGGSSGMVSVDYCTCSVTAKSGKDFTSKTGTLVFQEGETRKTITIPVLNDTQHEPDELFRIKLQNVQGSAVLGDKRLTSITIEDDDQ